MVGRSELQPHMNRRKFLRSSGATLTFVAGAATASTDDAELRVVPDDCNCDGTYEACCVDGPCDCGGPTLR